MLEYINARRVPQPEFKSIKSFFYLKRISVEGFFNFIRNAVTVLLIIAYLIITATCLIENHPMTNYLVPPMLVILFIAGIVGISKFNITNNSK